METRYTMFEESISNPELGRYAAYGIKAVSETSVSDVSLSRPDLSALVQQCNELQLSPLHLSDVIDDYLVR